MLLGSGELSRELAIALRHLGARVIAVDEYADAPAHGVADQSVVIPMTDADELAKIVQRLHPDFVVTAADAVAAQALEAEGAICGDSARPDWYPALAPCGSRPTARACAGWLPTSWACPPPHSGSSDRPASSRRWAPTPGIRYW